MKTSDMIGLIGVGSIFSGLALVYTGPAALGGWLFVGGGVALIYSLIVDALSASANAHTVVEEQGPSKDKGSGSN